MEEVEHIPLSVGLDQPGLTLLLVIAYPTRLVCLVSLAHEEESIAHSYLERGVFRTFSGSDSTARFGTV